MTARRTDREDEAFLSQTAQVARAQHLTDFLHLDQPIGRWNYIRIANDIAGQVPAGRVLDWGCGYGQMTYLLRRRGFQVTPFDVGPADTALPDLPLCRGLTIVREQHPTRLPFEAGAYEAVLSCGVLEHVAEDQAAGDELGSLMEIRRVLRPGGCFLIYQLPQRYAWQEAIIRRFKLGYSHPRRFTASQVRDLLAQAGFRIRRLRRANLIPKNLTGMPEPVRELYSRFSRGLIALDGVVCRLPGLNQLGGVLEVVAVRDESALAI